MTLVETCAIRLHNRRAAGPITPVSQPELTGSEEEPSELICFRVYKTHTPVIEQAIETAALMLGTDKSRGHSLEMICADFLAGEHPADGNRRSCLTRSQATKNCCPANGTKPIGDPTIADGILERLLHNAHRIEMRGESMRKKCNPPPDESRG